MEDVPHTRATMPNEPKQRLPQRRKRPVENATNQEPVPRNHEETKPSVKKSRIRPIGRTLDKVYYIQMDSSRRTYMERWLNNQTKVPFQRIVPTAAIEHSDKEPDWFSIYLQVASVIQQDLDHHHHRHQEQNGLALVLLDHFRIFDKTLGRLERALKWLPDDFDVARIDCFQTYGLTMVSQEQRKDFVQVLEHTAASDSSTSSGWTTIPRGGWYAMVWRPSRLGRIRAALQQAQRERWSMECFLASLPHLRTNGTGFKSYCLNFHHHYQVGCFHHLKPTPEVPNVESKLSGNICGLTVGDTTPSAGASTSTPALSSWQFLLTPLNSSTSASNNTMRREATNVVFHVAGIEYSYRAILPPPATPLRIKILVVGVCSTKTNFVRRQAIRQTWGGDDSSLPAGHASWRTYFVVAGRNFSTLAQEFDRYQDLIWVDTEEHYKTGLTPKTMAFVDFAQKVMARSSDDKEDREMFAFKTDDDMYLNVTKLQLDLFSSPSMDYFGLPMKNTAPVRDLTSKFYMSPQEYSGDIFPPYATGGGYAMSFRFLQCAVRHLPTLQILRNMSWEDVAIGFLAEACGISLTAASWDPSSIRNPGLFFTNLTKLSKATSNGNHYRIDIAHRVSIENQFRIHHGLPYAFDEDWFETMRLCPESENLK